MMESAPRTSVIIPVYNGERYLLDALDSVFAQTYRPLDVIVIDDGSTDGSAAIAQSFKELRYLYQMNQGVATARNLGIQVAQGEFIAFLDQDDVWTPNKLEVQIGLLRERPELGFVLAHQRVFFEPETEFPRWLRKGLEAQDHLGFLPGTLVVRKNVFARVGFFDTAYRFGYDDAEWLFRAKDSGVAHAVLPQALLHKRVHDANQLTLHFDRFYPTMLHLLKRSIDQRRAHKREPHD